MKVPLDEDINQIDSNETRRLQDIFKPTPKTPVWRPRLIGGKPAMGGISPPTIGSPTTVADAM